MPKGAASKDKKSAEKKGGDKGKGKSEGAADKGGKVRTASILGSFAHPVPPLFFCADADRTSFRVKAG